MALSRDNRRWLVAGIIAGIGLAIAVPIIVLAQPPDADPLGESRNSKQNQFELEKIGGKSAVFAAETNEFFASLFQGARLGYTIGATALVVAAISLAFTGGKREPSP